MTKEALVLHALLMKCCHYIVMFNAMYVFVVLTYCPYFLFFIYLFLNNRRRDDPLRDEVSK